MKKLSILGIVVFLCAGACALAQSAWTPPKGTWILALTYQNNFAEGGNFAGTDYVVARGQKVYDESIRLQAAYVDVGYAITDRLFGSITVPYMTSKYIGTRPHIFFDPSTRAVSIPVDNGDYHGGVQDLGFRLRYNVTDSPFMITPFIQYNAPSHAYPYYSHAVIGTRIAEFQIGTFLGGYATDRLYLAGGYGLGIPQRVMGISRTHHHMEFEGGYFLNEKIRAFGILHGQLTIGGLELIQDPNSFNSGPVIFEGFGVPLRYQLTGTGGYSFADEKFSHHQQLQKDSFLNVSAGAEYSITPGMSIYGVVERTLTNRNLHFLKYGFTFGVSWGFGGGTQRPCHC